MRVASSLIPALILTITVSLAAAAATCPGGLPVTGFELVVEPAGGGRPLPINEVNVVQAGEKLRYVPYQIPEDIRKAGEVSILVVPDSDDVTARISLLAVHPAKLPAEWEIPVRAAAVGFVLGPDGLSTRKINALVKQHPELVRNMTNYAAQSSRVEALVQLLSRYEESTPGTLVLNDLLKDYSAEYGIEMPKVNASLPPDEIAGQLLAAVAPSVANEASTSAAAIASGSTSAAAAVAGLFFAPEVTIAVGSAPLFMELHHEFFPGVQFSAAFEQPAGSGMSLCTTGATPKAHERIAHLWMVRLPDDGPPEVSLPETARVPVGWKSPIKASCAKVQELRGLVRARDWELVSAKERETIPVKVTIGTTDDELTLDLSKTALPPGDYKLQAQWDWTPIHVTGTVQIRPLGDLSGAKLTPSSQDKLMIGSGAVPMQLTGANFEFLSKIELIDKGHPKAKPETISFMRDTSAADGDADSLGATVDTNRLEQGPYVLRLQEVNGKTQDVPLPVHPPGPKLDGLPVRANLGEHEQKIELHGANLERIDRIASAGAEWKLAPMDAKPEDLKERAATLQLDAKARKGEEIDAQIYVAGIQEPLEIHGAVEVVGPRPKIESVRQSPGGGAGVAYLDGEIPADAVASFAITAANLPTRPTVELRCSTDADAKPRVSLAAGQRATAGELDQAGTGLLYLFVNPGAVGDSGCLLNMDVDNSETGASEAYLLGRVTQLPHLDKFSLTGEKIGADLYGGELEGQNLQLIEKTGWDETAGTPVTAIPARTGGDGSGQSLKIEMAWPPPSPHAALYIWLRGESKGRRTNVVY